MDGLPWMACATRMANAGEPRGSTCSFAGDWLLRNHSACMLCYLDPKGVDVYGWATLDGMRNEDGNCRWAAWAPGSNVATQCLQLWLRLLRCHSMCILLLCCGGAEGSLQLPQRRPHSLQL